MKENVSRIEAVRREEAYSCYRSLGYSDAQSVTAALINLDRPGGGFPEVLRAYDLRPATDTRSFSEFFRDNAFRLSGRDERREPAGFGKPGVPSFPTLFARTRIASASSFVTAKARSLNKVSVDCASPKALLEPEEGGEYEEELCFDMSCPAPAAPAVSAGLAGMPAAREAAPEIPRPSREDFRTDSYEPFEDGRMRQTAVSPTSTFRLTNNTAAASVMVSNIREGLRLRHSMVRTEELLNYLPYDLAEPDEGMFGLTKEIGTVGGKTYLFLGIQGRHAIPARQNICFLLDVSGSMGSRSSQMVMSLLTVLAGMNDGDVFSLVTYSTADKVVINGLVLNKEKDVDDILRILMKEVWISGCTNGSAGLEKAYDIVAENRVEDGVNRVILLTDGDLNFGIHDKDGLRGLISKKRAGGAYFSAIGTGLFNLQDDKLEALAKNGNGNYVVVNSCGDIRRNIRDRYEALVFPIAKNVKAQVEFNPAAVSSWRLIGYENRTLAHEDFRNDAVISEPFGSGARAVALYEIRTAEDAPASPGLKYQRVTAENADELATLTLRWEEPETGAFREMSFPVGKDLPATENLRKAVDCAGLAQKLRGNNPDALTAHRLKELFGD